MCRALKVLCAADSQERLARLKRAAVSTSWELVGGCSSAAELAGELEEWRPDVLVVDASLGSDALDLARASLARIRIVSVGPLAGADQEASSLEDLREAILGLPRPGGPVG